VRRSVHDSEALEIASILVVWALKSSGYGVAYQRLWCDRVKVMVLQSNGWCCNHTWGWGACDGLQAADLGPQVRQATG
jgi:hypothetical protein